MGTKGYDVISDKTTSGPWEGYLNLSSNPPLNCSKRSMHEEILIQHWEIIQTPYLDCGPRSGVCYYILEGTMCVLQSPQTRPPNYKNPCVYSPTSYPAPTAYTSTKVYGADELITRDWTETKCVLYLSGYKAYRDPLQYVNLEGDGLKLGGKLTELVIDGKRIASHSRSITLSPGTHAITMSQKKKGKLVRTTAIVTVEPRIAFEVKEPVLNSPKKNGTPLPFAVDLRNNTKLKRLVKIGVSSQPSGWHAFIIGKPLGMVGAGKNIPIQLEVVQLKPVGNENTEKLVPINIRAESGKYKAECTVYVRGN